MLLVLSPLVADEDDDDEEEYEEYKSERKLILQQAKQLQKLADFFAHPEKSVEVDGFCAGRSFFTRPSAPMHEEEAADICADALALKNLAVDYQHPEREIQVDATAFARNYFSQPWATEQESFGAAEERVLAIKQAQHLAQVAYDYQHPEAPIKGWKDPAHFARNYFGLPSTEHLLHDEEEERARVLQDTQNLKMWAGYYQHPEAPLQVDPVVFGRSYFGRAFAAEQETDELTDEREILLEEMKELKEAAVLFRHPEMPLQVDAMACARNYFDRPSVDEQDTLDVERMSIVQEMKALKALAVDCSHPERPLVVDPTCLGRNYYSRFSAVDKESFAQAEERAHAIAEAASLKKQALVYRHPERPMENDPAAFGRNYFGRPSAPEDLEEADEEERARVLQELAQLKKLAVDYMHPERPVVCEDPCVFGRNYFGRASAADQEEDELGDEREIVLAEVEELKSSAADFMHPERPVVYEDTCVFGRNYFGRASAAEQEEDEFADEREIILAELEELKQGAVDYMHPERPIPSVDPTSFGRSYFGRGSDVDSDSNDAEERERVMAEAYALKTLAVNFAHPELPLATDASVFGRNYFSRPSAPQGESLEEAEERAKVLSDTHDLRRMAADYAHPEKPISSDAAAFGRSYFSRASAPEQESVDEAEERAQIRGEAMVLEKLVSDYRHPEAPVETTDPFACGRNYFTRASAPGVAEHIYSEGFENPTERRVEADEHSHHDDYGHFEMDEDIVFRDMRQSIVLPLASESRPIKKQSSKLSSDEEGELSRSPSSVMLFTGALENDTHPPLPYMG